MKRYRGPPPFGRSCDAQRIAALRYCKDRSCGAAPAAARRAVKQGYTDVSVMLEGIDGWEQAGQPTVSS